MSLKRWKAGLLPIESSMNGLPGVVRIKSTSAFGMAVIYVYFTDDTDIYFARQLVAERLNAALPELPEMDEPPSLGPISTGLGQIFIYYLTADEDLPTGGMPLDIYLRDLNDRVVKYQLQSVPVLPRCFQWGPCTAVSDTGQSQLSAGVRCIPG